MGKENLQLAQDMLDYAQLSGYSVEAKTEDAKIFFITKDGEPQYEIWEVSSIWSSSHMDKTLIKKHEDVYFVLKPVILEIISLSMDEKFGKKEETF